MEILVLLGCMAFFIECLILANEINHFVESKVKVLGLWLMMAGDVLLALNIIYTDIVLIKIGIRSLYFSVIVILVGVFLFMVAKSPISKRCQ